jgi:2-oxoisovalerate dehydrogenase E2 component (dihydrolipoyl transacylase)
MLRQFTMPDVGEGLTEAEVVTWNVAPGDAVAVNQIICEIETAKAAVELPSPYAGVVGQLLVEPGETVSVGAPIIAIETAEPDAPSAGAPAAGAAPATPAPSEDAGAKIGEAGKDGRIATLVGYGPRPGTVTRRPRRTTAPPPARDRRTGSTAGGGHASAAPNGDHSSAAAGGPATTAAPGPGPASLAEPAAPPADDRQTGSADGVTGASASPNGDHGPVPLAKPPVRKLARDLGVDLRAVVPSGPGGVITRDDVAAHAAGGAGAAPQPVDEQPAAAAQTGGEGRDLVADGAGPVTAGLDAGVPAAADPGAGAPAAGVPAAAPPGAAAAGAGTDGTGAPGAAARGAGTAGAASGGVRREPIRGVRRATAAAMVSSAFTAPHVTEFLAVDVTETMALRDRLRASPAYADVKLTPLALVAKAVCLAARRTPEVNASWDDDAGEIVYYDRVHLGIAAATPRGLIVPKVRDADTLTLRELAGALGELTATARAGRTPPSDLVGGTFTITNVGVFGVDTGTPILNPGEAAILAVGAIKPTPWVVDGELAVRTVCQLALSFDHRLVDGEQGSRFLADVGALLTDPSLALTF